MFFGQFDHGYPDDHFRPASELMPFGSGVCSMTSGQAQDLLQADADLLHGDV